MRVKAFDCLDVQIGGEGCLCLSTAYSYLFQLFFSFFLVHVSCKSSTYSCNGVGACTVHMCAAVMHVPYMVCIVQE
jgi:hypothetical protein